MGLFTHSKTGRAGKDKVTFLVPDALRDLPLWSEQLFEESLGKDGKGVTIFYGENLTPAQLKDAADNDRVFVRFNLGGETDAALTQHLKANGYPLFDINLNSVDEVGGVALGLQRTVAAIAHLWDINFVNQPGVEGYKKATKQVLSGLPKGSLVQVPEEWKSAKFGSLNIYYTPFLASGIATEDELQAEVARLGKTMNDGAAVYAAMIKLSLKNQTTSTFEVAEFASFGQMTPEFRQALGDFRSSLFTSKLKMPAKIGEAPDKLHSYQQNIAAGKDMFFSTAMRRKLLRGWNY